MLGVQITVLDSGMRDEGWRTGFGVGLDVVVSSCMYRRQEGTVVVQMSMGVLLSGCVSTVAVVGVYSVYSVYEGYEGLWWVCVG